MRRLAEMNKVVEFILFWLVSIGLGLIGAILVIRYLNRRDLRRSWKTLDPGPAPRIYPLIRQAQACHYRGLAYKIEKWFRAT